MQTSLEAFDASEFGYYEAFDKGSGNGVEGPSNPAAILRRYAACRSALISQSFGHIRPGHRSYETPRQARF